MDKEMDKENQKDNYLRNIYYNAKSPASYSGLQKLWSQVKVDGNPYKLTKAFIKEWLSNQDTYNVHKKALTKFPREKIVVGGLDVQWEADLAEMRSFKRFNNNYSYFAVFIDIFSRYAWCVPMKTKGAEESKKVIESVFQQGRKPRVLRTDRGVEWTNRLVKNYLEQENVLHTFSYNVYHSSFSEALIKTLKHKIFRYMRENMTNKYVDVLPDIVQSYNGTIHSSTGKAPDSITEENQQALYEKLYLPIELQREKYTPIYQFDLGDHVRVSSEANPFKKSFTQQWSNEIFKVSLRIPSDPPRYKIEDLLNEPIKGTYYAQELQKVNVNEESLWRIEKVLRYRTKNNKREALIRWFGYSDKFDSWIDAKELKTYK